MDKETFEALIKTLHEQYKQEVPEARECRCKLGLAYNKDDEHCKNCYASGRVQEALFKMAIKTGNNQLALFLAFAALAPGKDEPMEEQDDNNE